MKCAIVVLNSIHDPVRGTNQWRVYQFKDVQRHYSDKAVYLGLRLSGLTQGKVGISSLAGRWFKPESLGKRGGSLIKSCGEGLRPLLP